MVTEATSKAFLEWAEKTKSLRFTPEEVKLAQDIIDGDGDEFEVSGNTIFVTALSYWWFDEMQRSVLDLSWRTIHPRSEFHPKNRDVRWTKLSSLPGNEERLQGWMQENLLILLHEPSRSSEGAMSFTQAQLCNKGAKLVMVR